MICYRVFSYAVAVLVRKLENVAKDLGGIVDSRQSIYSHALLFNNKWSDSDVKAFGVLKRSNRRAWRIQLYCKEVG